MKISLAFLYLGASILSSAQTASSSTLEEARDYIDMDGSIVGFIDFDGDGKAFGDSLNSAYQNLATISPEIPQIPVDFPALFETLGFGSIRAVALSSKMIEEGLYVNRSVTLLDGEPRGLMGMYGLESKPFLAAQMAPADATTVLSMDFKVSALRDTALALATQILGPMGEGMMGQYMEMPIPGSTVVVKDAIEALSGGVHAIIKQEMGEDGQLDARFWISLENAGSLIDGLEALANSASIELIRGEDGIRADLSPLVSGEGVGLFIHSINKTGELRIFSDQDWADRIESNSGNALMDTPEFKKVFDRLPSEAAVYSYSSGFDFEPILMAMGSDPAVQPYLAIIREGFDSLLGGFFKANASAAYLKDGALVTEQYAGFSYKQALMLVPVAFGSAITIPMIGKMKENAQEKMVTNNLRQIVNAASVLMREKGIQEVRYSDIVGPGKMIESVESVLGESYESIVISSESVSVSVDLPDGGVVEIETGY